jgi:hypothetical protein
MNEFTAASPFAADEGEFVYDYARMIHIALFVGVNYDVAGQYFVWRNFFPFIVFDDLPNCLRID